jgi:ribosomal protein L34
MEWIRKDYDSPSHAVAGYRDRVQTRGGGWMFQARTACGRKITGLSGGSIFRPDCKSCRKVLDAES